MIEITHEEVGTQMLKPKTCPIVFHVEVQVTFQI